MGSTKKEILKTAGKILSILVMGAVIGFVMIAVVYTFPTERMKENVLKSVDMLVEEGAYPRLYGEADIRMTPENFANIKVFFLNTRGTARDNITDSTMLNTAVYDNNDDIISKSMRNSRASYGYNYSVMELKQYLSGEESYTEEEYSRYWHGYLVILKPLLLLFSYGQIRWLNVIGLSCLLVGLIFLMYRRHKIRETVLFGYVLLFTMPIVIPFCMQYCTVSYIVLAAMIYVVARKGNLKSPWAIYFFVVTGMLTSYIDFLTFPLLTLGLPLTYMLNQSEIMKTADKMKKIFTYSVLWAIGYVGMWSSKWIIASVVLKENTILEAVNQIIYRSSSVPDFGEFTITPLRALASNLSCFTNVIFLILIAGGLTAVVVYNRRQKRGKWYFSSCIPYLFLCMLPFIWVILFKNHSYNHGSFTYRIFALTVYSGMSMLINCRNTAPIMKEERLKMRSRGYPLP